MSGSHVNNNDWVIMIQFKNIDLSFNGKKIIQNLSFEINRGEKVVFSGKSGSGKSSIFNLLLGFTEPDRGEIIFKEELVDEKSVWNVRKEVAYIDQDVSLGGGKTAELFSFVSGLKTNALLDFNGKKIDELLTYFELGRDILNKDTGDLSGGERQRLSIVIAILLKRNIFFLDEVTSSLDGHLKQKVVDYFVAEKKWTCLVNSHDSIWLENPGVKIFNLEEGKWKP